MSTLSALEVTPEQAARYREEGFVILERALSDEHLALLREECAAACAREDARMDASGADVRGISRARNRYFIAHASREAPRLYEFLFCETMAAVCRATLGPDAWLFWEQFVVKAADKGETFGWHQDSGYVFPHLHEPYLTCWCALDDMSIENGTVHVLPFSRTGIRTMVEHKADPEVNDKIGYFGKDPGDPAIVPAGSVVAFSSVTFHRSGFNRTPRPRRVYVAQYSKEPLLRSDGQPWGRNERFLENGRIAGRQSG